MDEQPQNSHVEQTTVPAVKNSIKRITKKVGPGIQLTLLASVIFNLAIVIVGSMNLQRCPVNKNIPIFLIAIGAIAIVSKLLSLSRPTFPNKPRYIIYLEAALYTIETVFFFLGTYWVYKEFKPSYNPDDGYKYCDKTAYLFAFVYLTIHYTIILAMLIGYCCFIGCAIFLSKTDDSGPFVPSPNLESGTATVETQNLTKETEGIA